MMTSANVVGHKLDILISGAGIAGLTAAHFLLRAGHDVTIIERASALRASGQNVDVRGHGLTVLKRMKTAAYDVEDAVRAKTTQEKGLRFVDSANSVVAEFPVDGGTAFTGEIEIMRGDLANILYQSIHDMPGLEMIYGRQVCGLDHDDDSIQVKITGGWQESGNDDSDARRFNLVLVADGIFSSTRPLVFPKADLDSTVQPLGQWSCWFSIPRNESDSEWARWYNATKGRMVLIRPDSGNLTRVSLWTMTRDGEVEKSLNTLVAAGNSTEQRQFWAHLFRDAGWETPRVLKDMNTADDFYMQQIAQVKTSPWSMERVALLGDAGYCPSPVSGMGVTTAMTGAYVLAGEIVGNSHNLQAAFEAYEQKMRAFVSAAQQLFPGTPGTANPETAWGIWILHRVLGLISWSGVYKLLGSGVNPPSQAMVLPEYKF